MGNEYLKDLRELAEVLKKQEAKQDANRVDREEDREEKELRGKRIHKSIIDGEREKGGKFKTPYEEITASESFAAYIPDVDPLATEDLRDDFENRHILKEEIEKRWIPEKRAITKEKEERSIKRALEGTRTYSPSEFKLMENASRYSALAGRESNLKKYLPRFADGTPLTVDQINELANEYAEIKKKGKKSDYSQSELALLAQASTWKFFHDEIEKTQKRPTFPDGTALSKEQIKELVNEYHTFRKENPKDFAEMKVENNEWQKDVFKWKADKSADGKQIFVADKPIIIRDKKTGKETKVPRRYILRDAPAGFKPAQVMIYYYIIKGRERYNIYIDLKPPY